MNKKRNLFLELMDGINSMLQDRDHKPNLRTKNNSNDDLNNNVLETNEDIEITPDE